MLTVSRVAVATLEEARGKVCETLLSYPNRTSPAWDALFTDALTIPESGGTITLPDGTVIEVEQTTWLALSEAVRDRSVPEIAYLVMKAEQGSPEAQQRILDAFTASGQARG